MSIKRTTTLQTRSGPELFTQQINLFCCVFLFYSLIVIFPAAPIQPFPEQPLCEPEGPKSRSRYW